MIRAEIQKQANRQSINRTVTLFLKHIYMIVMLKGKLNLNQSEIFRTAIEELYDEHFPDQPINLEE